MRTNKKNRVGSSRRLYLIIILGILISIQIYTVFLNQTHAEYCGILFGSEAEVSSDGINDIWQLEKKRFTYIAMNQSKPEIDLKGLFVTRDLNKLEWCYEYENITINATDNKINYIYNYSFSIPLIEVQKINYTFITNKTYDISAIEFYNWTDGKFYNETQVDNKTSELLFPQYYSTRNISIRFNISHSEHFIFWINITFEFWFWADQIISIQFDSLNPGNDSLTNNITTWIFLDIDEDDKLNYAIRWIYGNGTFLYNISNDSFTLGGWWNGAFDKVWTGVNWRELDLGLKLDIGILETNRLNVTIPAYVVNLTSSVRYAVWSKKDEPTYDWWDALPDDPNWQLAKAIPGFQLSVLGLSILIIGMIFLIKKKRFHNIKKMAWKKVI